MRAIAALLLLAAALCAGPQSGAVAAGMRWSDARGTPSGSRRSDAIPVTRELESAWTFEAPGPLIGNPVLWDGLCYVLYRKGKRDDCYLAALDVQVGTPVAKKWVGRGMADTQALVWDGIVVFRCHPGSLDGYCVVGSGFNRLWRERGAMAGGPWEPVAFEGSVYTTCPDQKPQVVMESRLKLSSLHRDQAYPGEGLIGRPAVLGPYVFALGYAKGLNENDPGTLTVYRWKRGSPALQRDTTICENESTLCKIPVPPGALLQPADSPITVAPGGELIHLPLQLPASDGSYCNYAIYSDERADVVGLLSLAAPPAVTRDGQVLCLEEKRKKAWVVYELRTGKGRVLAEEKEQPDLFRHPFPPVLLGDVAYFGGWAADLKTEEILWRLSLPGLSAPLIPADGLVLAVVRGREIRAFRGKGKQ